MQINNMYQCNKANYGSARSADRIKYIVLHYTANKTDTAKANAMYFKNNQVKASAHYFVDDAEIYQSVEDLKTAWAVGGGRWSDCNSTGGGTMYGKITNSNSISIEMCSKDGAITEATQKNAVELTKRLMATYNIPIENVYRHFDVNGKHCPGWDGWWNNGFTKWIAFKNLVVGKTEKPVEQTTYKVKIIADVLNIRSGAGTTYPKVGTVTKDQVYTIIQTDGTWGKLKSGAGWISVSTKYVKRV